jgi:hypothetical protein
MARGVGGKSPSNVARYLSGIDFPARKADLINHAKRNGAEDEVLQTLEELPEGEYQDMAEVMQGYGEARQAEDEDEGEGRAGSA